MKKSLLGVFTLAVVCMFVFQSCQKEDKTFKLTSQKYAGASDSKAYIDEDNYACWSDGDVIIINATCADVSLSVSNSNYEATVSGIPQNDDGYYALYPASYCDASSFTIGSTITLPSEITYDEENGRQVIKAPMAAKADENTILNFKNLCTLLKVHFPPTNNIVKEIYILSKGNASIVGSASVTFNGLNPALGPISGNGNMLTLNCGTGVNIKNGKDFYLPIPPLTSGQVLELAVRSIFGQYARYDLTVTNPLPANAIIEVAAPPLKANEKYEFYDWIWSQESGYIDLGIKPDNTSKMELTYAITIGAGLGVCSHYLTGSRDNNDFLYFSMGGSVNRTDFQCSFMGSATINEAYSRELGVKYRNTMAVQKCGTNMYRGKVTYEKLDASNNPVITNTLYSASCAGGITSGAGNIYVFALKAGQLHKGMKLYGYRVWKDRNNDGNSELVADFVPASRVIDGQVGIYNMATEDFIVPIHTAGKPDFVVGND